MGAMRIFLIGAIVLMVFMIIATAAHDGLCLGVTWDTWLGASLLSFFVELLTGWTAALPSGWRIQRNAPQ